MSRAWTITLWVGGPPMNFQPRIDDNGVGLCAPTCEHATRAGAYNLCHARVPGVRTMPPGAVCPFHAAELAKENRELREKLEQGDGR